MENILFEVKNLSTKPGFRNKFHLEDISFALPQGYLMGLVGKNGAGKTTFFRTVLEEGRKYTGSILLSGQDVRKNHLAARNQIGWISEDREFLGCRTLLQNGELLGRFYENFDMELFRQSLSDFELSGSLNVNELSRGQNMKFQLAFVMAHHPRLYLIDEATAGMDPVFRVDFYKRLRQLLDKENCSVILTTHNREEITKELDYLAILEEGRLLSFGENEEEILK